MAKDRRPISIISIGLGAEQQDFFMNSRAQHFAICNFPAPFEFTLDETMTSCILSTHFEALLLLVFALASLSVIQSVIASQWTQWTCDELTTDLCDLSETTGHFELHGIRIKYWRYRRKERLLGGQFLLPVITLHGGPSWPHGYMLPLKQLACRGANEVIFYDQAGCGESSLPDGANITSDYPHLLDPAYYSEMELPALIDHLKLDQYHILGHSWGTILAQLFALNAKNTTGLKSLTLSGPLSDANAYIAAQWDSKEGNLASLPPFVQKRIHHLEDKKQYDSDEYQAIDEVLSTFFTLRTAPAPDCFTDSAKGLNNEIYIGMQGASEFTISGVLGDMNLTSRLPEINVPVLLTHGAFDTMRPSIVKTMQREIKQSERKLFSHSGHVSMIDDTTEMNDVLADFFGRVEVTLRQESANFQPKIWEKEDEPAKKSLPEWSIALVTSIVAFLIGTVFGRHRKFRSGYAPID